MKRLISILLVALLCAGLIACGGPPSNVTPVIYQLGCNALNAADDYIGGKISSEEAAVKIDEYSSQIDVEMSRNDESTLKDMSIQLKVYSLSSELYGTPIMSEVMQARDDLAKALGK